MRTVIESKSRARWTRFTRAHRIAHSIIWILGIVLPACTAAGLRAEKHPPAKPIDLNAANAKELQELPGVGPVTAKRIIDLRQKNGRFKRVEDLLAVRGISQKKLDAIRPYITVSVARSTPASSAQKAPATTKKSEPLTGGSPKISVNQKFSRSQMGTTYSRPKLYPIAMVNSGTKSRPY